jgi:Domain of unknown function (DUF4845)
MNSLLVNRRPQGITLMGFVILLTVIGFFAYMGMRLFGPYNEYNSLRRAMDAVAKEPGAINYTLNQARASLEKRLYIDYVQNIPMTCLSLDKKAGANLSCAYERRQPFLYNIEFLITFNHTVKMGG